MMDSDTDHLEREIIKMWRILLTTKQMCFDRGYEIGPEELSMTIEEFRNQCCDDQNASRAKMSFTARPSVGMLEKYGDQIGTIRVEFRGSESGLGIKQLKEFGQLLDARHFWTGILVTTNMPTASAMKIIPSLKPIEVEIFREEDLLVNISRHELVPKHILLSASEKKYLLDRYRLKETQLPRIRSDDPMSKYLGLRRGQVVKIIRKSETAGRYASYRYVI